MLTIIIVRNNLCKVKLKNVEKYDIIYYMEKASQPQVKLFFALCRDAGLNTETMKERAKKKFGLEHFTDINSDQISNLIELLQKQVPEHTHQWEVEAKSENRVFYKCKTCPALLIDFRW